MLKTVNGTIWLSINKKCCSVDGGRGICPLFSSPPWGIWQLKSPHPREFAIQGKKNANARGSARGGGAGRKWNWLMHYKKEQVLQITLTFCHWKSILGYQLSSDYCYSQGIWR